jgi:hypothetical protein
MNDQALPSSIQLADRLSNVFAHMIDLEPYQDDWREAAQLLRTIPQLQKVVGAAREAKTYIVHYGRYEALAEALRELDEEGGCVVTKFKQYRRSAVAEMADWYEGFDMAGVSVSDEDKKAGSPKVGDKIARNPKNHNDKWLVAAAYFADNFAPLDEGGGE